MTSSAMSRTSAALADFSDPLHIRRRRRGRAQRRPTHRLHDECCGSALRLGDSLLELSRVLEPAICATVRAIVRTAVAVRNACLRKLPHHRQIDSPPRRISADRHRAQRRSVITLAPADHLVALGMSTLDLILSRQLQRALDRLRTSAGKKHRTATKRGSGEFKKLPGKLFRNVGSEVTGVGKLEPSDLLGR